MKRKITYELQKRAKDCIAQGALTNSKRLECLVNGIYPSHLKSGSGASVQDIDGNNYVDYICGLGANLVGYANESINHAIFARATRGITLSLATDIEVEFCEKLKTRFPFCEKFKILKTGSEACSSAIKIARAFTDRSLVLSEGYHGHMDEFVALTPPAYGCVQREHIKKFESLSQITNEVAAIILEPVQIDWSDSRKQFLNDLRQRCTETGTVLIFDEVITGFRFLNYSVANHFNIKPDLIVLGKALGGGLPLGVVGGRTDIMNCKEYFVSSTFAGETLSLAAGLKTLELLEQKMKIEDLWNQGLNFYEQFNKILPDIIRIEGYPTRGRFVGSDFNKALFWQESCKAGILFGPSFFFNFCHNPHTYSVINTCRDILMRINEGEVTLEGELPRSPFSAQQRSK